LIHGSAKAVGGRARHAEETSANDKLSFAKSFTADTADKTGQNDLGSLRKNAPPFTARFPVSR
jgi:hypothetical protein